MPRKLTFKCVITSGLTPFIDLQQQSVALQQNGNSWSGSLAVDVDDTLNLAVTVNGINGSPWTVDITIDCPGGSPAKIFSRNGTIPDGGSEGFKTSAKVPVDPCASKMGMAVVKAKGRPKKKTTKTKKKTTTKPKRGPKRKPKS
jgi:hypothetical protein